MNDPVTFVHCPHCGGVGCAACNGDGVTIATRRREVEEEKREPELKPRGRVLIDVKAVGFELCRLEWGEAWLRERTAVAANIEDAMAEARKMVEEIGK